MAYRPRSRIVTSAALAAGVVPLDQLKEHLRVTGIDEDFLIGQYGQSATLAVERWTQRLLTSRQVVLKLQCLPSGQEPIELPGGVVASVTSVVADGVAITGGVALGDSPAVLVPAADWPAVVGEGYPVTITYMAGFTAVPMDLQHAVKMLTGEMYDRRSNAVEGPISRAMVSAEYLMAPHRIWAAA